jgi:hypothetical protein
MDDECAVDSLRPRTFAVRARPDGDTLQIDEQDREFYILRREI